MANILLPGKVKFTALVEFGSELEGIKMLTFPYRTERLSCMYVCAYCGYMIVRA